MINIKIDSRKVVPGDTFVAIQGATVDGHAFVNKAIEAGATKVVLEKDMDVSVEKLIVEDSNKWLTDYVSKTYSQDVNEMNLIVVRLLILEQLDFICQMKNLLRYLIQRQIFWICMSYF